MRGFKLQKRTCPICLANEKKILYSQRFVGVKNGSLLNGYEVVVCHRCGFCFADNLPDQAAFDEYYQQMSKYEHQDCGGHLSEFDTRRYPATARIIQQFVPDRWARILDVGCATGGLLYMLKKNRYQELLGLDPSAVCAQTAERLYQIRVLTCTLSDLPAGMVPFDLIILGSVLEHIQDLRFALSRVWGLLAEGGMVYIEVPDATRFANSIDAPFQEFSLEHINYFSPASLDSLLQAYHFIKVSSQQTTIEQTPGTMSYEIKAMFRKKEEEAGAISPIRDLTTEEGLTSYIVKSTQVEKQIDQVVNALAMSGRPVIVWGVGTHTQRLLATSRLAEVKIEAFVDSNPRYQGKELNGIPIIAPVALKDRSEPILISTRVFQKEIEQQIRSELKLENELKLMYPF